MITIGKATLSGATPERIREQTQELAPARLRELARQLAADPELTVSVITYEDGTQELEVLRTGPPYHTEDTIDRCRFTRPPRQALARTLSIASQDGLRDAMGLVRDILYDEARGRR